MMADETKKPLAAAIRDWMKRTDVEGDALRFTVLALLQFAGGLKEGDVSATIRGASLQDIADIMAKGERTVRRRLGKLRDSLHLSWTRNPANTPKRKFPNIYSLFLSGQHVVQSKAENDRTKSELSPDKTETMTGQGIYAGGRGFDFEVLEVGDKPCLAEKRETQNSAQTSKSESTPEPADPRHAPLRDFIKELHEKHFGCGCPWSGREGKRLSQFLESVPDWTLDELRITVTNYFASCFTTPGVPPFAKLPAYRTEALDEFGRPTSIRSRAENRRSVREWMRRDQKILAEASE